MKAKDEDYYLDKDGNTIFKSSYYRKRGSCCKSNCLHCPYGTTVKNLGVELISFEKSPDLVQQLVENFKPSSIANSLLSDAFGKKEEFPITDAYALTLKSIPCGLAYIQNNKLLKLQLLEHFDDQGITESYINSLIV